MTALYWCKNQIHGLRWERTHFRWMRKRSCVEGSEDFARTFAAVRPRSQQVTRRFLVDGNVMKNRNGGAALWVCHGTSWSGENVPMSSLWTWKIDRILIIIHFWVLNAGEHMPEEEINAWKGQRRGEISSHGWEREQTQCKIMHLLYENRTDTRNGHGMFFVIACLVWRTHTLKSFQEAHA